MKVAIIHISDFHVRANENFLNEKISKFMDSLNVLGNVDEYVIVFSGDLAYSGQINEYRSSRYIIGKLIYGIKQKNGNDFVDVFIIPGNHDLALTDDARGREYIQKHYDDNCIEKIVPDEIKLLDNFYTYSHANARIPYDKIVDRRLGRYGDYQIQFNLINTSLFSTLSPDDKELHYFPLEKMRYLNKSDDVNLCITVMHHSSEWFNWKYKSDLEKTIINNSEMLLTGHDHYGDSKSVSIGSSLNTWISCAGEMKFSEINFHDSFNSIVIDTDTNTFCGYTFDWNAREKVFIHKVLVDNKPLQGRKGQMTPLPSFVKDIKEDEYSFSHDFTQYFVFPKLISEYKNEFGKREEVKTTEELLSYIEKNKNVWISGSSNSGKTTLLKHLFCSLIGNKIPLILFIDSTTKINPKNFIKRLFEDQYGDDSVLFEKYEQTEKSKKVLIVDGWDYLTNEKNQEKLLKIFNEKFDYVILSTSGKRNSILESVKEEIIQGQAFQELRIKPFFAEKRNQLVKNICMLNNPYSNEEADKVNKLIDSLVQNNSSLFSLNPGFIIRYTDYFIKDRYYDYSKGEAVFSKVFEYELQSSIIQFTKKSDVDEVLTAFEEIAGYMYKNKNDVLKVEEIRSIIEKYNEEYGVSVNASNVLEIGKRAKLFKETVDLAVYFTNKNYLAYFIAKYLIRNAQNDETYYEEIEYVLKHICFGINSDIVLFISYLLSNTRTVMSIAEKAGELLSEWEEIDYSKDNIAFLRKHKKKDLEAPTKEDHEEIKKHKESTEESHYSENIVEAKGLFDYDESEINEFPNRLVRAMRYTEIICKSIPAFNNSLKLSQKEKLIEGVYSYPHKILFALLKPVDDAIEEMCDMLLNVAQINDIKKSNGNLLSKEDILDMFISYANAMILSTYDHFAELCTSSKTIDLLINQNHTEVNKQIQRLMIIENSGGTDAFIKEAENMMKKAKDDLVEHAIMLIVRKHLLCNPELQYKKKNQIIDRFFGKGARKTLLLNSLHNQE